MSNIKQPLQALLARILEGDGVAPHTQRRSAFANSGLPAPLNHLIAKVAMHAYKVTDGDIAAQRQGGLSEDQIFENVVCAAVGQANRQYEAALAALRAAGSEE